MFMFDTLVLHWAGRPLRDTIAIIIVLVGKNTHLRIGHRLAEKTITVIGPYKFSFKILGSFI